MLFVVSLFLPHFKERVGRFTYPFPLSFPLNSPSFRKRLRPSDNLLIIFPQSYQITAVLFSLRLFSPSRSPSDDTFLRGLLRRGTERLSCLVSPLRLVFRACGSSLRLQIGFFFVPLS